MLKRINYIRLTNANQEYLRYMKKSVTIKQMRKLIFWRRAKVRIQKIAAIMIVGLICEVSNANSVANQAPAGPSVGFDKASGHRVGKKRGSHKMHPIPQQQIATDVATISPEAAIATAVLARLKEISQRRKADAASQQTDIVITFNPSEAKVVKKGVTCYLKCLAGKQCWQGGIQHPFSFHRRGHAPMGPHHRGPHPRRR
jgi:hypothetical protein